MTTEKGDLTAKQEAAIISLVAGQKHKDAAAAASVRAETVSRWKRDPRFLARLNELQQEQHTETVELLRSLRPLAVQTLGDLASKAKSESVRHRAARSILELTSEKPTGETDPDRLAADQIISQANDSLNDLALSLATQGLNGQD